MSNPDQQFVGSIPNNYERYMVPMIFEPYARDIAERVSKLKPHNILETAAGTGVVTAALAKTLSVGETMVATDLNPAMLDIAKIAVTHKAVSFQQADATTLPFADESFDVVVCQFGVMFFPDKIKGFKEALRVLCKGGTFVFNVWDSIEFNEIAAIVNASLAGLFPENPPTFIARIPHGYNDIDTIQITLKVAGFETVTSETLAKRSLAPSAKEAATGYCQGTPMRGEIDARDANKLELATYLAERAIVEKFGTGQIDAHMQAIVFTATKP